MGKKRQITRAEVEQIVLHPDQLVYGDLNILIAQSRRGGGLSSCRLNRNTFGQEGSHPLLDKQGVEILEGRQMKLRYDEDSDVLFLMLRDDPPVDAIEEPGA